MAKEIKWNDRFNVGVESIDSAHRKLFSIVGKLIALNEDEAKQQHACREGIKYFKSYTMKHFADEEAYMQSIGYPGLAVHKSLHDSLRDKTLPALEAEMEAQDYSTESVGHFLGICVGWLNGHIIVEDRAITGKNPQKWVHQPDDNELESVEKALMQGLEGLSQSKTEVISRRYSGEAFSTGKTLCFRLTYRTEEKKPVRVYLIYEESLVLQALSEILRKEIRRIDETVITAMKLLSEQFVSRLQTHFPLSMCCSFERNDMLTFEQFVRTFDKEYPPYSLLLSAEGKGYFAFCAQV
ncbi:MAG: hemerythrin family protein [Lachnospiraceae bacterium]|jgi:hemerythrin-like metal-binding protein|nr:hemerythrin family protein [Lachnospiraceae bacterium]